MNDNITIIIITYKSENIIYDFINKIPANIKTIIIENSQNEELKKNIEQKYKNISFYTKENNGVSSALNFAVGKVDTKYFLQISPDIDFNYEDLIIFYEYAKKIDDKFAAIGPRFLDVKAKSHKQIQEELEFAKIKSIHGSCMFINKKNFYDIGKFDENFFLYFEETEYCYRGMKKGYSSYQLNKIKVKSRGRSVNTQNDDKQSLNDILIWHFIWSKFYFTKKKYGKFFSIIIFIPLFLRTNLKILYHLALKNKDASRKYKFRLDGLIKSAQGKKSYLRP